MAPMGMFLAAAGIGAGALPEPTSYQAIGWLVVALAALATAVNQAHSFMQRTKDKPTGGEVAAEVRRDFLPMGQAAAINAANERRISMLEDAARRSAEQSSESRKTLYAKMDNIQAQMSAEITRVHQRVDDLQAEVRAVPSTVVRLINDSRNI